MKYRNCKHPRWAEEYPGRPFFGWCDEINDSPDMNIERECRCFEPATNVDIIRRMTDKELAEQLVVAVNGLQPCTLYYSIPTERTFLTEAEAVRITLEWLQQPAEEDT